MAESPRRAASRNRANGLYGFFGQRHVEMVFFEKTRKITEFETEMKKFHARNGARKRDDLIIRDVFEGFVKILRRLVVYI